MTRSTHITIACLLLLFVTTACSKPVPNSASESATTPATSSPARITSESVVKVEAQPVEISSGGSAEASVRVTIQSGYHINAKPADLLLI